MPADCGHTVDNNRVSLIVVLSFYLVFTLATLSLQIWGSSTILAQKVFVLRQGIQTGALIVWLLRLVAISLGLIGVGLKSRHSRHFLLAFFVVDIVSHLGQLATSALEIVWPYARVPGLSLKTLFATLLPGFATTLNALIFPAALVLVWQTRRKFMVEKPYPCAHTTDNNKIALISLLIVCIILSGLKVVYSSILLHNVMILNQVLSLVTELVAIVSMLACLAFFLIHHKHSHFILLGFFILGILIIVCRFVIPAYNVLGLVRPFKSPQFPSAFLALAIPPLAGVSLALAFQSRLSSWDEPEHPEDAEAPLLTFVQDDRQTNQMIESYLDDRH